MKKGKQITGDLANENSANQEASSEKLEAIWDGIISGHYDGEIGLGQLSVAVQHVNTFWQFQANLREKNFSRFLISCVAIVAGISQFPDYMEVLFLMMSSISAIFLLLDIRIKGQLDDTKEAYVFLEEAMGIGIHSADIRRYIGRSLQSKKAKSKWWLTTKFLTTTWIYRVCYGVVGAFSVAMLAGHYVPGMECLIEYLPDPKPLQLWWW